MSTTARPLTHCSLAPVGAGAAAAGGLAVTGVALAVATAARTTPSVLIAPMEALGWSRADLSMVAAVNLLCFGLAGPFGAALGARAGLRRTLVAALLAAAAATAAGAFATAGWQLALAWGLVLGAAAGVLSVPLAAMVALRVAPGRQALCLGAAAAVTGAAQLIAVPGVTWVAVTWSTAVAAVAAAAVTLAALPLARLAPAGRSPVPGALAGLRRAVGTRVFWVLSGLMAICGAATQGLVGTHLVPAVHDHGIPEVAGAGLLAVMGVLTVVGALAAGWMADRWDPAQLLFVLFAGRALMLVMLPFTLAGRGLGLVALLVVFGLDWAATVPAIAAIARREAGDAAAPVLLGWVLVAHHAGAGLGAVGGGLAQAFMGSYVMAFMVAGLLSMAAAVLSLGLWHRPVVAAQLPVRA